MFIRLALLLVLCSSLLAQDNVLVVVLDDVGPDRISVYGIEGAIPAQTPVIDALAKNGQMFTDAYAQCVCSPTRLAALSGQYGFRTGVGVAMPWEDPGSSNGQFDFDLSSVTSIPSVVSSTHSTAAIGKWHLSTDVNAQLSDPRMHPIEFGFDYFNGTPANLGVSGDDPDVFFNFDWNEATPAGVTTYHVKEYATTHTVDVALDWIKNQGLHPWFAWVAFHSAHNPVHAPPSGLIHTPVDEFSSNEQLHKAMVEAVDTELGRLLAGIRPAVFNHTWVIVIGDNGNPKNTVPPSSVWPPEGKVKPTTFEGNVNVPLIVYNSFMRSPGSQNDLVNVTDLHSTILNILGYPAVEQDSISFAESLVSPNVPGPRQFCYGERFSPNGPGPHSIDEWYVTDGRWKLSKKSALTKMFDLQADPTESTNLLSSQLTPEQQQAYDSLSAYHTKLIGS